LPIKSSSFSMMDRKSARGFSQEPALVSFGL
jgi:hypothetical protein